MKFVSKVNTALFAIVTCALWSQKPGFFRRTSGRTNDIISGYTGMMLTVDG